LRERDEKEAIDFFEQEGRIGGISEETEKYYKRNQEYDRWLTK